MSGNNLVWHPSLISLDEREHRNGHRAAVVWLTGLPSSGKSTTAHAVERKLFDAGNRAVVVLDGDNVRHGLSADLGFSAAERAEHLRRTGELAKLMFDAGMVVLCAFVSPSRAERERVRNLFPAGRFFEAYCSCAVETCEKRDPKGFYARARTGEIRQYTGVSAAYEAPQNADIVLDTGIQSVENCTRAVMGMLREKGVISS